MLFPLNFLLAKMLKDRLEDEEGHKKILLPSFRRKKKLIWLAQKKKNNVSCLCNMPVPGGAIHLKNLNLLHPWIVFAKFGSGDKDENLKNLRQRQTTYKFSSDNIT